MQYNILGTNNNLPQTRKKKQQRLVQEITQNIVDGKNQYNIQQ